MRAGAAWRGWCYLLTACDTQLGFTMRRTYGVLACNCQAGRDSQIPVLKRLWFGTFSAPQVVGMGPEDVKYNDVRRSTLIHSYM